MIKCDIKNTSFISFAMILWFFIFSFFYLWLNPTVLNVNQNNIASTKHTYIVHRTWHIAHLMLANTYECTWHYLFLKLSKYLCLLIFSMDGNKTHSWYFSFVRPKTRIIFDAGHIHSTEMRNIVETFKHNKYFGLPDLCCYAACRQCSSTFKYDKMNAIKLNSERNHHATKIHTLYV